MSALQATELFRQTQVQIAAAHNALPVVEYLASCPEVDMGVRSLSGQTTLHLAAMMGHIDIIRFLLQVPFRGLRIGRVGREPTTTPCSTAQHTPHVRVTIVLISAAAAAAAECSESLCRQRRRVHAATGR